MDEGDASVFSTVKVFNPTESGPVAKIPVGPWVFLLLHLGLEYEDISQLTVGPGMLTGMMHSYVPLFPEQPGQVQSAQPLIVLSLL